MLVFDWGGLNAENLPLEVIEKLHESMCDYQLNSVEELYLLIWFSGDDSEVFEWNPIRSGKHTAEEVCFSPRRK